MECLFCSIAKKEINAEILYEDESTLAFLDINPRSTGMTIVIPKKHYTEAWEDEEMTKKVFSTSVKVSEAIKKALKPLFVSMAVVPSQISHFHVRLYPVYEGEMPLIENRPKKIDQEKLKQIAEVIRKNIARETKETKELPKETKRSEQDVYWIKRELNLA